jgi:hypothetical protein
MRDAQKVLSWLEDPPGESFTVRELIQRGPNQLLLKSIIDASIRILVEHHQLVVKAPRSRNDVLGRDVGGFWVRYDRQHSGDAGRMFRRLAGELADRPVTLRRIIRAKCLTSWRNIAGSRILFFDVSSMNGWAWGSFAL